MKTLFTIYTDGACSLPNNVGGYAAVIVNKDEPDRIVCGSELNTNNVRMELTAIIAGLDALGEESTTVRVVTDYQHVGYIREARDLPNANIDLWMAFWELKQRHYIIVEWQKSRRHAPHQRAHQIARSQMYARMNKEGDNAPRNE